MRPLFLALMMVGLSAWSCGSQEDISANATCDVLQAHTPLPNGLDETSGAAVGRRDTTVLWTHNDSGGKPRVWGVRVDGSLAARVDLPGAMARDWEDIAAGPCGGESCLYVGDIGDNLGRRDDITIYRIPEPSVSDTEAARVERFPVSYPGGPRDAEALFVLPDETVYIVTKGRNSNVAVYRYPSPLRAEVPVELERVVDLTPGEIERNLQVTGADATVDGARVAIRTYTTMAIYSTEELFAGGEPLTVIDLRPVGEGQGEAVAFTPGGDIVLTSEAMGVRDRGTMNVLRCAGPASG